MKKFLLMLILVGVAGWLVYTRWWKPAHQPPPVIPPPVVTPTEEPPQITTPGTQLFDQGEYKDAARKLEKEINNCPVTEIPRLLYYLARAYEKLENQDRALATWQRLLREQPASIYCGEAYYKIGHAQSDYEKRLHYLQQAVEKHPESSGGQLAAIDLGEYYLQTARPEVEKQTKARAVFSIALQGNLPDNKKQAVKQKLTDINKNLVFSPAPTPDSIIYKVIPGDTIWSISNRHKVPPGSDKPGQEYLGQIRRINNFKTSNIRADDELKIITGKFHIEIDKSDFTLTLYLDNNFVKEYPVAVGDPKNPTRTGTFHLTNKVVNPPWYRRDESTGASEVIPFGDPRHIIGTRWMGFKEYERLGIHGTAHPESIGKAITKGCVRMHNTDIEELFDLVADGTEVVIKE